MSWKSLVTAGLLCVLASPAFAVPAVSVVPGGTVSSNRLDASGNWVWNIQISNTNPVPTGSSPLAAELGFTSSNTLGGATVLNGASNFDTANPGKKIFGWEPNSASTSNPAANSDGLQVSVANKQIFAALGSVDFATVGPHDFIQITTAGPKVGALTSTVTLSGAYSGKGRIAELTGATTSANYDTMGGSVTFTAKSGDVNLDGNITSGDFAILQQNYGGSGKKWNQGDFNGDGSVTSGDFSVLQQNYGTSYQVVSGGFTNAGVGAGGAVPEPASISLVALAALAGLGLVSRKR